MFTKYSCLVLQFIVFGVWLASASKHQKLMVMIDDPVIACQGFDQKNAALDFTGLEFIQVDDDEFIMNGTFIIHRDVIGKVPINIKSWKFERGMWVNCYLNQRINDICKNLAEENRQEWQECLKKLSDNGKCPFLKRNVIFDNFKMNLPDIDTKTVPRSMLGKFRSEIRFQNVINDVAVDIGCGIVTFELQLL